MSPLETWSVCPGDVVPLADAPTAEIDKEVKPPKDKEKKSKKDKDKDNKDADKGKDSNQN